MKKIISLAVTLLTGFASIGGGIADNIAYSGNNTTVQEQAYSDDTAYVQTAVNNTTKVQPMNTVYTVSMPYCNVPECTIKEEHTHGACGVSGCMEVGEHTHSYCNVSGCTVEGEHTHGACGVSGCMEVGEHTHSYCNVSGCTVEGEHTHGACGVSECMEVGEHTHSNDTGTHHSENKERHSGKKGHH